MRRWSVLVGVAAIVTGSTHPGGPTSRGPFGVAARADGVAGLRAGERAAVRRGAVMRDMYHRPGAAVTRGARRRRVPRRYARPRPVSR